MVKLLLLLCLPFPFTLLHRKSFISSFFFLSFFGVGRMHVADFTFVSNTHGQRCLTYKETKIQVNLAVLM